MTRLIQLLQRIHAVHGRTTQAIQDEAYHPPTNIREPHHIGLATTNNARGEGTTTCVAITDDADTLKEHHATVYHDDKPKISAADRPIFLTRHYAPDPDPIRPGQEQGLYSDDQLIAAAHANPNRAVRGVTEASIGYETKNGVDAYTVRFTNPAFAKAVNVLTTSKPETNTDILSTTPNTTPGRPARAATTIDIPLGTP